LKELPTSTSGSSSIKAKRLIEKVYQGRIKNHIPDNQNNKACGKYKMEETYF
jgi:hypothetical protein